MRPNANKPRRAEQRERERRAARPAEARRTQRTAREASARSPEPGRAYQAISGLIRAGRVSYLLPRSPAADRIEVEMKLDAQEDPRPTGWGWCSTPGAKLLPALPPLALPLARQEGWGRGAGVGGGAPRGGP